MPKLVKHPKTMTQIVKDSDTRRGVKVKGFKLSLDDIARIEALAKKLNIPQSQMIMRGVALLEKQA